MSTYIFGSKGPVQPAQPTYAEYLNLTDDLELAWASSFVDTNQPVATTMLFSTSVTGIRVLLPNATQAGVGTSFRVINNGDEDIDICDFAGPTLFALIPSTDESDIYQNVIDVTLQDNSTPAGEWLVVNVGGTTSSAGANALAGYGLISLPGSGSTNTLNVNSPARLVDSSRPLSLTDRGSTLLLANGVILSLPDLGSAADGFFCSVFVQSGIATLDPVSGVVFGSNTPGTSVDISIGQSCVMVWKDADKTYVPIGLQQQPTSVVTTAVVTIPDDATTYNLQPGELTNNIIILTGNLSGSLTVFFGELQGQWTVHNLMTPTPGPAVPLSLQAGASPAGSGNIIALNTNQTMQIYLNASSGLYVVDPFYNEQAAYVGQPIINTSSGPAYSGLSTSQYGTVANKDPTIGTAGSILEILNSGPISTKEMESLIISGVVYVAVGVDTAYLTLARTTTVTEGSPPDPSSIEINLGSITSTNTTLQAIPFYYFDTGFPPPPANIFTVTYTVSIVPSPTGEAYFNCTPAEPTPLLAPQSILAVMGLRGAT